MSDATARFALPLLAAGQAQKELFHNEGLTLLDALVHPLAQGVGGNVPPGSPLAGQCWIVGDAPVGGWAGHARALAAWTDGGWRFAAPTEGMAVWLAPENVAARYIAGAWVVGDVAARRVSIGGVQVVGARGASIGRPRGGSAIDAECRTALAAVISALESHGLIGT